MSPDVSEFDMDMVILYVYISILRDTGRPMLENIIFIEQYPSIIQQGAD